MTVQLALTDEQEQLWTSFDKLLSQESSPQHVRSAETTGFDTALWEHLVALGVPAMGVSSAGEEPADLVTLSVLAECVGRHLAPVPVLEAVAANRLLSRVGEAPPLDLEVNTLALRPSIDGQTAAVPAGAIASRVVGMESGNLILVCEPPPVHSMTPNLGSLPIADRRMTRGSAGTRVLAEGATASAAHRQAVVEWWLLSGALLVGLSQRALEIAVAYVTQREQFGVPIGSFQSVAHALADAATSVEGARLLVRKAAWALDAQRLDGPALTSMSFVFAAETASSTTSKALHFHGGYGFMLEYDIQLYFRRAKAWSLLAGGTRPALLRLADELYGKCGGQ